MSWTPKTKHFERYLLEVATNQHGSALSTTTAARYASAAKKFIQHKSWEQRHEKAVLLRMNHYIELHDSPTTRASCNHLLDFWDKPELKEDLVSGRPEASALAFRKYLERHTKKNGDQLTETTIEAYTNAAARILAHKDFDEKRHKRTAQLINQIVEKSQNGIVYSAGRHFLKFLGASTDAQNQLRPPNARAKAHTSKRFLQTKVMTKGEIRRLVSACDNDELELAIRVIYDLGARKGAANSILWADTHLMSPRDEGDKEYMQQGIYGIVAYTEKGQKRRQLFLSKSTVRKIREMHAQKRYTDDDYLLRYTNIETGAPIKNRDLWLWRHFTKLCEKVLGRHHTVHDLRHSSATHWADAGADALDIKALLGHEKLETTEIYTEISEHRTRMAFEKYSEGLD